MSAQEATLLDRYEFYLARFDPGLESVRVLAELEATRAALVEENRALREQKEEYLTWQYQLGESYLDQVAPAASDDTPNVSGRLNLRLEEPMTIEECHDIAKARYTDICAFTESEHLTSSGMTAFGWTDRRRVNDGRLQFSLEKVFPGKTAYELMARTWFVVSSPEIFCGLHSRSINMRCELVQRVDANNVVIYQEYHVRERDVATLEEMACIKRCLVLHTFFETEKGFVILYCSLDPKRLADWPNVCGTVPPDAQIKYDTLPSLSWMAFDRDGPSDESCRVSNVGIQDTRRAFWAIEILQIVLRWERDSIGPIRLLNFS